tara:strand:- start:48 stop:404 length:357 start_codon:yes stop_codon:yes gene_type:complete
MIIDPEVHTDTKIRYALDLFKGANASSLGNIPNTMNVWHKYTPKRALPYHLHPEVSRIAQHWYKHTEISRADQQFLDTVYTATPEWLTARAYVLGQWVKFPTEKPKTHNLVTGNTFKR